MSRPLMDSKSSQISHENQEKTRFHWFVDNLKYEALKVTEIEIGLKVPDMTAVVNKLRVNRISNAIIFRDHKIHILCDI